jgi:protein-S-isoprenylcysteine O-methyltransferase Ste14
MIISANEPFITKLAFVVVALIIGVACFVALMAVASVVMPKTAARSRAVVSRWPVQAFLAGLATLGVGGSLAYYFLLHGYIPRLLRVEVVPGMLAAGLALVTLLLTLFVVGATGVVRFIGARLTAHPTEQATPVRQIVVGTLAGVFGSLFPVVGWALVLPGLLATSAGAPIVAWLRYRQLGLLADDEVGMGARRAEFTPRTGAETV